MVAVFPEVPEEEICPEHINLLSGIQ